MYALPPGLACTMVQILLGLAEQGFCDKCTGKSISFIGFSPSALKIRMAAPKAQGHVERIAVGFRMVLAPKLEPRLHKMAQKPGPTTDMNINHFLEVFGSMICRFWGPTWEVQLG